MKSDLLGSLLYDNDPEETVISCKQIEIPGRKVDTYDFPKLKNKNPPKLEAVEEEDSRMAKLKRC